MLFVLAHNISVSSIYSSDGDALPLNKTKPNKPFSILFSRFGYHSITSTLILLACSIVLFIFSKLSLSQCIFAFIMMWGVAMSHIVWSGEIDFLNPKPNIFKTEGASAVNPNEIKSTVLTFLMSAITFGILMFFMLVDMNKMVWFKLALVSLGFLAVRIYLFIIKARTLFKEM